MLTEYPSGFELDHIITLVSGGRDDDEDNLQILCSGPTGCHAKKTLSEGHFDSAVSFYPEWLEPSAADLTIVFGPPGSGKSTYVREHAGDSDTVIDLDEIVAELSGQPIYHAGDDWLRRGAHFRNRMLAALKDANGKAAWFVNTGLSEADRDWWVAKLKPASVIVMRTDAATCRARVNADARRPAHARQRQVEAIEQWWQAERGMPVATGRKPQYGADGWPT